ncbi:hypothetical protein GKB09_03840 [Campylobacter jejuni]|nr:hypothetical protein [Campylobacter jejuni]EHC1462455.1 hypothetical protein [Campylobacter jejuni]EIJ3186196.1 hypothetical protein [Campylobacter jejuni]
MFGEIILGGASIVGGLLGSKSASAAQKQAADYQRQMLDVQRQQFAFMQAQYANWEQMFGSIGNNLSTYFKNLNPDTYAAKRISLVEQEYNRASEAINADLARRGMANSGAAVSSINQLEINRASARVDARLQAEQDVRNQQLQFLGIGMGQQPALLSGMQSSANSLTQTLGNVSANYQNQAMIGAQNSANMIGSGIGMIGSGIADYFTIGSNNAAQSNQYYNDPRFQTNGAFDFKKVLSY